MSKILPETVQDAHAYTRSRSPWIIGEYKSAYGKLIHYLAGGGMSTFGRTVRQEEMRIRQRHFLWTMAVLAVLWLVFYIF